MAQIKLGELLIKANVLRETQLKAALAEQARWGGKLGEILVRMNMVTEDLLVRALSKQLSMPAVNLDAVKDIPKHVLTRVPVNMARDMGVMPLQIRDDGKTLVVAMADPLNVRQLDELRAVTKCRIVPNIAGRTSIARALSRFYDGAADLGEADSIFKMVDAQGRTVVRNVPGALPAAPVAAPPPPPPPPPPVQAQRPPPPQAEARPAAGGSGPMELLRTVEELQRKEVAALKAMVELLIEKGVFSRDEYLAKIRR